MARGHDNALLLRLALASLVIYGHAYAIIGVPGAGDVIAQAGWGEGIYSGSLAVDAFFFTSGFMVTGSWLRRRDLLDFLRARALRIYPAYLALVLITVLLIGPWQSQMPLTSYFGSPQAWLYLGNNLRFEHAFVLPGVFVDNPLPHIVNGSLGTLRIEVMMYLSLAGFAALGFMREGLRGVLACIGAWLGIWLVLAEIGMPTSTLRMMSLFYLGAFCWLMRGHIRLSWLWLMTMALLTAWSHGGTWFTPLLGLTLGYACLLLIYAPTWHSFNRLGDYSYGTYLWGYLVQQCVASRWPDADAWFNIALSLPISIALAVGSWHLVEKPALRLARRKSTASATASSVPHSTA